MWRCLFGPGTGYGREWVGLVGGFLVMVAVVAAVAVAFAVWC